ncbi:MAG: hypothetical protein LBV49_02460 [Azonexus sp.]|nr:hypothetical protein [Azonexus sp.]
MTSVTSTTHTTIQNEIIQSSVKASANIITSSNSTTVPDQSSSIVSISGEALVLARLFGNNPATAQKVEYQLTTSNFAGSFCNFLTLSDRQLLARVYEYATVNGIDLEKVDTLATKLGSYRACGPGPAEGSLGTQYQLFTYDPPNDPNGRLVPVVGEFSAENQAIANSVLTSKAMNDTELDHGFIESLFNPDRMGATFTMNRQGVSQGQGYLDFVRKIVFAFSTSGADGSSDPTRVAQREIQLAARAAKIEWLMADPERASKETDYLARIANNAAPVDTASATGASTDARTQLLTSLLKNNGVTDLSGLVEKLSLSDLAKSGLLNLLNRSALISALDQNDRPEENKRRDGPAGVA